MQNVSIRPWLREDAQALAAIANDRNIFNNLRDLFPHPYTVMDALQWFAHSKDENPVINFAVLRNDVVAGSIGCVPKNDVYRKNIEVG